MALNILITGANSGFGLLSTKSFAKAGHIVHAGYRNPAKIGTLQALANDGLKVVPVQLDVTDPASVNSAVAKASQAQPIDVLVNNAGFEVQGPIEHISDATYYKQFDTNVLGVIRMVRAVAPIMRAQKSGVIINLSSVVGIVTPPYAGLYAASKHAVEAISEALSLEMRPFGIRVAMVEPGAFPTEFGGNVMTEPGFTDASPYYANAQRFRAAMGPLDASHSTQNPQDVADAIVAAATTDTGRLRHLVGADAAMVVGAYRASPDFESFSSAMFTQLGVADMLALG